MISASRVAVRSGPVTYSNLAPFHPSETYPELPFKTIAQAASNSGYAQLRQVLADLGLNREAFGSQEWNPFGEFIRPGQSVVLKPNFVLDRNESGDDIFASITHPSILRALVDYVFIALKGEGSITIADAPQLNCDWDNLMSIQRLASIQDFYKSRFNFTINVHDLREGALIEATKPAYGSNRKVLAGDPKGSIYVDLGKKSHFAGLPSHNLYGADYNRDQTIECHTNGVHRYKVSRTILDADVVISVPKMKVHKKVGVTLNCKGLVGINTDKNCLIHYRVGTPSAGGDQLPDTTDTRDRWAILAQRWCYDHLLASKSAGREAVYKFFLAAYRKFIKPFRQIDRETVAKDSGNWYGNDSAWRMTADLAHILYFADRDGKLDNKPHRKVFCLVDGIIAGEKEGPLAPTAKRVGALVAGFDPLLVDICTARLMGFDPRRIRQFSPAFAESSSLQRDLSNANCVVNGLRWSGAELLANSWCAPITAFTPHSGWIGHIEILQPQPLPLLAEAAGHKA